MRPVKIMYILVALLSAGSWPAYAFQRTSYLGNRGRTGELMPTAPRYREVQDVKRGAPKTFQKNKTTVLTVIGTVEQDEVLPGLPKALIAVVEGNPFEATKAPTSIEATASVLPSISLKPISHPMGSVPPPTSGPVSLIATTSNGADPSINGLFLPFEAGVGAAAFARGDDVLVVFDAARPLDLSAVQSDPIGARSSIQLLPEATILRLPGQRTDGLTLRRFPSGWLIHADAAKSQVEAIAEGMDGAAVKFSVKNPGRTVIVPDPQTGGNLLVGTVLDGDTAVPLRRHGVVKILEQTIQGIVIDPLSDGLELHPTEGAFMLSGIGAEALDFVPVTPDMSGSIGIGPRIMSLAAGSPGALSRRFRDAKAAAAAAPAESRFLPRLRAAQDALALGDAAQATAIMDVASADDARDVAAPLSRLVVAAAALLAHRPDAVNLPDDTQNTANGETELWQAVKLAEQDPASSEAARLFAATMPLLRSYPAPLQVILLPIAAESLVRSGSDAQAAMVDHLPAENALAFAKAALAERRGQTSAALAMLDHLALDQDVRLADKAVEEAVAIRGNLPSHDPRALADLLEAHLLDARLGGHEIASRLRLADLLIQSSQYRKALQLLRDTASLDPGQTTEVRRRIGMLLKHLATAPSPGRDEDVLDQAAMIEANADMLPAGAAGSRISLSLAARLMALDLPERALPIVRDMMHAAEPGPDKAELGLKLAALYYQENDLEGVRTALRESDPGDLPPDQCAPRLIMMARALAGSGQIDQALAAIASVTTDVALDLKASLLARRGDWDGTTDTLMALAAQGPVSGGKPDGAGEDMLLRLASAASHTKDMARINHVKALGDGRFADPGKAALFHLLTSDPAMDDDAARAKNPSETAGLGHAADILNSISR